MALTDRERTDLQRALQAAYPDGYGDELLRRVEVEVTRGVPLREMAEASLAASLVSAREIVAELRASGAEVGPYEVLEQLRGQGNEPDWAFIGMVEGWWHDGIWESVQDIGEHYFYEILRNEGIV